MSKIVLMGDSITAYMPYIFKDTLGNEGDEVKYFGIENIGVGTYMNYLWPKVDHENVDTYILLIGINNILRPDCDYDNRETLDELVNKLKEFINKIIIISSAELLVQSIYPTRFKSKINEIKFVNEQLKLYCEQLGVTYLDLYNLLKDEEELFDRQYTDDGIHPNNKGYKLIAEEINKYLHPKKSKSKVKNND